jgi:hypothetical protein
MFCNQHEPLALLVELTPKLAKKRFRESIYQAWDHKCGYCNGSATSLDHIVPRFKSGCSNRNNLIPACCRCNSNKASTDMETWYKQQDFFTQENLDRIKTWMIPDSFNLIDLQSHKKAS